MAVMPIIFCFCFAHKCSLLPSAPGRSPSGAALSRALLCTAIRHTLLRTQIAVAFFMSAFIQAHSAIGAAVRFFFINAHLRIRHARVRLALLLRRPGSTPLICRRRPLHLSSVLCGAALPSACIVSDSAVESAARLTGAGSPCSGAAGCSLSAPVGRPRANTRQRVVVRTPRLTMDGGLD